jgi:uncharacterized protein (DUF433 family)
MQSWRAALVWLRHSRFSKLGNMNLLDRITRDPTVMGGRPCIRGMRVSAGLILGLLAAGHTHDEIIAAYPYVEADDIRAALAYAAWRSEESDAPLSAQ